MQAGGVTMVSAVAVGPPAAGAHTPVSGVHTLLAGSPYGGIRTSTDDGATWALTGLTGPVRRLAFNPVQPAVALAAASDGLWRSADAGLTWTQVTTQAQVFDVAFAADGSAAYATFLSRIWRSTDTRSHMAAFHQPGRRLLNPIGLSADGAGLFTAQDAARSIAMNRPRAHSSRSPPTWPPAISCAWRLTRLRRRQTLLASTSMASGCATTAAAPSRPARASSPCR